MGNANELLQMAIVLYGLMHLTYGSATDYNKVYDGLLIVIKVT